jgi:hypothetical protein
MLVLPILGGAILAVIGVAVKQPWSTPAPARSVRTCAQLPFVLEDASKRRTGSSSPNEGTTFTAGFFSPSSRAFVPDPGATATELPYPQVLATDRWRPVAYDAVLHRWLPVALTSVSPDHRLYPYIKYRPLLSATAKGFRTEELHVANAVTGTEHRVWTGTAPFSIVAWTAQGIIVQQAPPSPNALPTYELIDPSTGHRSPASPPPAPLDPRTGPGTLLGYDRAGQPVIETGSRADGGPYAVIIVRRDHRRTVVHEGTHGRGLAFDPSSATDDGARLWFTDYDLHKVWSWTAGGDLRSYAATGIAASGPENQDHDHPLRTITFAGGCAG